MSEENKNPLTKEQLAFLDKMMIGEWERVHSLPDPEGLDASFKFHIEKERYEEEKKDD